MIAVLCIAGYIAVGMLVGKLGGNIFLNSEYKWQIKKIPTKIPTVAFEDYKYMRQAYPTYEDYLLAKKREIYEDALEETRIDRNMSMGVGILFWPVGMWFIVAYYIYLGFQKTPALHVGFSAAGKDIRKTAKNLDRLKAERKQQELEIENWNNMVDILNANGMNDITQYEKKKLIA